MLAHCDTNFVSLSAVFTVRDTFVPAFSRLTALKEVLPVFGVAMLDRMEDKVVLM